MGNLAYMGRSIRKPADELGIEVGSIFQDHITRQRLTQFKVAEKTGISKSQISRYMRGEGSPTLTEFGAICNALNLDPILVYAQAAFNVDWRERVDRGEEPPAPTFPPLRPGIKFLAPKPQA